MTTPDPLFDAENTVSEPRARWGIREMVLCIIVVLIAVFIITTVIAGPFAAAYGDNSEEALVAASIANLVWSASMIAAVLWFVRRGGGDRRDLGLVLPGGSSGIRWNRFLGLVALTFLSFYVIVFVYGLAIEALGFDFLEPAEQVPDEFYNSDLALAVLGIAIIFGAPVAEEIFFRGFLFGGTRSLMPVPLAALVTGVLFSIAHFNSGLVIPFTLIGASLAISYQRSGTLLVPVAAHFLFNLVSFSALAFVPEARPD